MKRLLIEAILAKLSDELAALTQAALAAREAATHEESKPEDQYDTRGLEASYLAGAQAERAAQIQRQIAMFKFQPAREWGEGEPIAAGALVELRGEDGRRSFYLLVAEGGGLSVRAEGQPVQVITPRAPLGEALLGRKAGDAIEVEIQGEAREYEILGVR